MKNTMKLLIIISLAAAIAFGMVSCGDDDPSTSTSKSFPIELSGVSKGEPGVIDWHHEGGSSDRVFFVNPNYSESHMMIGTIGTGTKYVLTGRNGNNYTFKRNDHTYTLTAEVGTNGRLTISNCTIDEPFDLSGKYTSGFGGTDSAPVSVIIKNESASTIYYYAIETRDKDGTHYFPDTIDDTLEMIQRQAPLEPNLAPEETSETLGPVAVKNNYLAGSFPINYYIAVWVWTDKTNYNYYRSYVHNYIREPPSILNLKFTGTSLVLDD